jgi:hypothetical protein
MYIEKVANFGVAMATLGHNIDPSLNIHIVFETSQIKLFLVEGTYRKYVKQE